MERIDQEPRPAQRWRARGGRYEVARIDPKVKLASEDSGRGSHKRKQRSNNLRRARLES
jgi:hypothetical protein